MFHVVEQRRKGGLEVVVDGVEGEALALPGKVVVVGDDGDGGFGDHLGHGQPQRHVHRDGQDVLRHQDFELELLDEAIEFVLEPFLDGLNLVGHGAGAEGHAEELALHLGDFGMVEEGERRGVADFRGGVELAGHPEAGVAHALKDMRPFAGFEGDAVGAVKAGGDEADALGRAGGEDAGRHRVAQLTTSGHSWPRGSARQWRTTPFRVLAWRDFPCPRLGQETVRKSEKI